MSERGQNQKGTSQTGFRSMKDGMVKRHERTNKRGDFTMAFELKKYTAPDFTEEKFVKAPDALMAPAP